MNVIFRTSLSLFSIFLIGNSSLVFGDQQVSHIAQQEDSSESQEVDLPIKKDWTQEKPKDYHKPEGSIKDYTGHLASYVLWVDPYIWHEIDRFNPYAERSFKADNGEIVAFTVVGNLHLNLEGLRQIIVKNSQGSGLENINVIKEEKRLVNGTEVLFIHWKAKLNGNDVDFLSYLTSGNFGTVVVHTYTPSSLFNKNLNTMQDFLNGLVLKAD